MKEWTRPFTLGPPLLARKTQRLLMLNNYNALFAVFTALNSSTIARLRKTWDGLAPKYRQSLEVLRRATDHSRNYAEYRGKIRQTVPPCLPFVGVSGVFALVAAKTFSSSPIARVVFRPHSCS